MLTLVDRQETDRLEWINKFMSFRFMYFHISLFTPFPALYLMISTEILLYLKSVHWPNPHSLEVTQTLYTFKTFFITFYLYEMNPKREMFPFVPRQINAKRSVELKIYDALLSTDSPILSVIVCVCGGGGRDALHPLLNGRVASSSENSC